MNPLIMTPKELGEEIKLYLQEDPSNESRIKERLI